MCDVLLRCCCLCVAGLMCVVECVCCVPVLCMYVYVVLMCELCDDDVLLLVV